MINSIYLKFKPFLQMTSGVCIFFCIIQEFAFFSSNLSENFSIILLNIRSLQKNIDKLKDFLDDIKGKFSVIVPSETWIDDDKADLNSLFHIPNYSFIDKKRKTNH